MRKVTYLLIFCFFTSLLISACNTKNNESYTQSEVMMDTPMKLTAYGPNAKAVVEESFRRLHAIDDMANPNSKNSDVSKINDSAGKAPVKVSPEVIKMISFSMKYSKLSGGAFDVTLGPIINLWGIGTDKARVPSQLEIKALLPLIGYDKIAIDEKENTVMLQKEGMSIDLGGIAKGFAADEVLDIFKKYKIEKGLINLGSSSIYAIGLNKDNSQWSIGIKHPRVEEGQTYLGIIKISDQALSTSGDYERYFVNNNKRYHHIINPATGFPADNGVMSDTIIIDGNVENSNMLADLLTTTVFVLGPENGIKFAESLPNVYCEITTIDNKIYTSAGFKDKISNLHSDFKFAN